MTRVDPRLRVLLASFGTAAMLPVLAPIERLAFDARLSWRRDGGWPPDLVLVPIDDAALSTYGRWPWPRSLLARLLEELEANGVSTIALDVVLEARTTEEEDAHLADALGRSVLAIGYHAGGGTAADPEVLRAASIGEGAADAATMPVDRFVTPFRPFADRAAGVGHAALFTRRDGIVRGHVPRIGIPDLDRSVPSLAWVALARHRGTPPSEIPLYEGESYLDVVPGGPLPRAVRAGDVLAGTVEAGTLAGALAVVYVDSDFARDRFPSALGPATSGGLLLAYALRTLDGGRVPIPTPHVAALAALLIPVVVLAVRVSRLSAARILSLVLGSSAVVAFVGLAAVPALDLFVPVVSPIAFLVLAGLSLAAHSSRLAEDDRIRLRALLESARQADAPESVTEDSTRSAHLRRPRRTAIVADGVLPALAAGVSLDEPVAIGRYSVRTLLGRGGMGAVFLAFDGDLKRPVAFKVMRESAGPSFQRFRREATAVARLANTHVVQIHEVGLDEVVPYLVMEYVPGGSVAEALRDEKRLPWLRATRLVEGVARGLGAAHAAGIVHRDVKPGNLLLVDRAGDVAKVTDFGIARLEGESRLTRAGTFLGTLGYAAPEQITGGTVDPRTDVYALGIAWWEIVVGMAARTGNPSEIMAATMSRPLPEARAFVPDLPEAAADLLSRMTSIRPERRPRDGIEVAGELARLLPDEPRS